MVNLVDPRADTTDWSFNTKEIAATFDKHVRSQLPFYDMLTNATVHLARSFVTSGGRLLDVGSATGNVGRALIPLMQQRESIMDAVEPSETMIDVCLKTFSEVERKHIRLNNHTIEDFLSHDSRADSVGGYCFISCFLTLMFVSPPARERVIKSLIDTLAPGGAMVVVDKVEQRRGIIGQAINRMSWSAKLDQGQTAEEIVTKELSLAGQQIPFLSNFRSLFVTCETDVAEFFQFGEFVGLLVVKRW